MIRILGQVLILLCFFPFEAFAQKKQAADHNQYARMSRDEIFEMYRESCEKELVGENCFQMALMLKKDWKKIQASYANYRRNLSALKKKKEEAGEKVSDESLAVEAGIQQNTLARWIKICEAQKKAEKNPTKRKNIKCGESKFYTKYFMQLACQRGSTNGCKALQPKEETTGGILFYGAIIFIGIAVWIITNTLFQDEDSFRAQEKLEEGGENTIKDDIASQGIVLRYSRPFFKRYVTPIVSSMKSKKKIREKYKRRLASAGLTDLLTPEDFYSFKLFLILGFPIMFLALRAFLEETWSMNLIPVLAAVGYIYPDIWIKGKIEQRQKEVIMAMPFSVDMLALSVEAGLDFMAAITKVVEKAKPSPLNKEFEILLKEIKIGASRAEALRNMAWRIDLIQISSFCATLIAADSVGASIGPILKSLAVEIRQKKSSDVEKAGATAATKILFPMLFLIVPAVFIIVAAPVFLELLFAGK